jgi:hypothetical protein
VRSQSTSADVILNQAGFERKILDPTAAQVHLQDAAMNAPGKVTHGRNRSFEFQGENIKSLCC